MYKNPGLYTANLRYQDEISLLWSDMATTHVHAILRLCYRYFSSLLVVYTEVILHKFDPTPDFYSEK